MTRNRGTATLRGCDSKITEDDLSSYRAAPTFLFQQCRSRVFAARVWDFCGKSGSHILRLLQHLENASGDNSAHGSSWPDLDQLIIMQEIARALIVLLL